MRGSACVHRAGSPPDHASVIVTCVHGTWARGARWPDLEQSVADALDGSGPIAFQYFEWSGRNSVHARTRAAADLRHALLQQIARTPHARHVLVAHSHGAALVLRALSPGPNHDGDVRSALAGIVLLSPPLVACEMVDEPTASANKLLLAAFSLVPLLLVASNYLARWLAAPAAAGPFLAGAAAGPYVSHHAIGPFIQMIGVLVTSAIWLLLFRPEATRRRAETLARQLAVPRFDFPGLVIRASRDEATFALASASTFARMARRVWRRVLRVRPLFLAQDDQRLRDAQGWPALARALFEVLILVPMSISLVTFAQGAAADGRWFTVAATVPWAIMWITALIAIVGGSLLLLLVLPVFSILLWPFGIFPTVAAALLNVSVTPAPSSAWQVIEVDKRGAFGWNHSVHQQRDTLTCIHGYVRDALARASVPA
jgi:hypothetical protein